MIHAVTTPLRSKRVHIGMDEAHGVSEGRYRQLFGFKESTKVVGNAWNGCLRELTTRNPLSLQFTDHLRRVNEICVRKNLAPMIWSDSEPFFSRLDIVLDTHLTSPCSALLSPGEEQRALGLLRSEQRC